MFGLRNPVLAVMAASLLVVFAGGAQAGIINGDFSNPSFVPLGTGGSNLKYEDIDDGWYGKSGIPPGGTLHWVITGGKLTQPAKSGSETRMGQAFSASDMTGTGWTFEFDLVTPGSKVLRRMDVWAGKDDQTGNAGQNIMPFSGNSAPNNNLVVGSWTPLVDLDNITGGHISVPLVQDMSDFDLIAIRMGSRTTGLEFDNIEFNQATNTIIPEPSTLLIWSLGLLGLVGWRRRRK